MTADDILLTDIDAWDISGPPALINGRWQGGRSPGANLARLTGEIHDTEERG